MRSSATLAFMLVGALALASVGLQAAAQSSASAGEAVLAAQGRTKAAMCAVCHGPAGVSNAPDAPHLAGQPAPYLAAQLKAYRSGARKHEVMAVIAKPLSDDDIAALVAWYSAIKVEATLPQ